MKTRCNKGKYFFMTFRYKFKVLIQLVHICIDRMQGKDVSVFILTWKLALLVVQIF